MEALKAGKEIEFVYVQTGLRGGNFQELSKLLVQHKVPLKNVPIQKLNQITRSNHQGVVASVGVVENHPLEEIVAQVFEKGEVPFILVLDRVTDTRNLGAIARTAECAGVQAIVLPQAGSAQINADTLKTSAGALNYIPICKVKNLTDAVVYLKTAGLQVVAATEKAKNFYYQLDLKLPTVFLMGSEESGISPNLIKLCDAEAKIPMAGKTTSLNVSVAASILIYETVRQRNV
jgi:23S rRNA (guanosine2251-2'-O)-methyltransferase